MKDFLLTIGNEGVSAIEYELKQIGQNRTFKGKDFVKNLTSKIGSIQATNALYLLLNNGNIRTISPGLSIEKYVFSVSITSLEKMKEPSLDVAIIESDNEIIGSTARIVVTLPPHVKLEESLPEGIGWIYPSLRLLIRRARSSIDIVNPFFDLTGMEMLAMELSDATTNGVQIRALSRALIDDPPNQNAIDSFNRLLEILKRHGNINKLKLASFHQGKSATNPRYSSIHAKALITDRHFAYIGSANLTEYSLRSNFEAGVILEGQQVEAFSELFDSLWEISDYVEPTEVLLRTKGV
jgi:phosphatidylserine/phosphatidylglycerophosphate/cardiolipin synthase-like enzyme